MAASLSNIGGLDLEKHQVIAASLERGMMKRLSIPEERMSDLAQEEDSIVKDAEALFIASKFKDYD